MNIKAVKGVEIGAVLRPLPKGHGSDEMTPHGFLSTNAAAYWGNSTGQDIVCTRLQATSSIRLRATP